MLIGQTLYLPDSTLGETKQVFHGPWASRGGDAATFVAEVLQASSASSVFKVEVETKNSEDIDTAASSLGIITLTGSGRGELSVTGCEELVRFRFTVEAISGGGWVHARTNPPMWQPN